MFRSWFELFLPHFIGRFNRLRSTQIFTANFQKKNNFSLWLNLCDNFPWQKWGRVALISNCFRSINSETKPAFIAKFTWNFFLGPLSFSHIRKLSIKVLSIVQCNEFDEFSDELFCFTTVWIFVFWFLIAISFLLRFYPLSCCKVGS